MLFWLAQILPKNIISFKIALILRKITLRNKVKIIDQTQFDLKLRLFPMDNLGDRFLLFLPKFFEYDEFQLMSQCLKEDSIFIGERLCLTNPSTSRLRLLACCHSLHDSCKSDRECV